MHVRFLLGPAGSGKTHRCLGEIRASLAAAPEGPLLILLAPKQATYQLERQLLADPALGGYTRLQILSFERLARFVLRRLGRAPPRLLDEEGRVMVLRGLLAMRRDELKLFRASARLTGFAQELSRVLGELRRSLLTPESLRQLADQAEPVQGLPQKLQDLATLLQDYEAWLAAKELQDADGLLTLATKALEEAGSHVAAAPVARSRVAIASLWMDGFAELSSQELDLLGALVHFCDQATLAFCLDQEPAGEDSWLSNWSIVGRTCRDCRRRVEAAVGSGISVEVLPRQPEASRFANSPLLQHLEQHWAKPRPFAGPSAEVLRSGTVGAGGASGGSVPGCSSSHLHSSLGETVAQSLRLAVCVDPEAEAKLAAREILEHVRAGGRYREVAVLVRRLEAYHQPLRRVFSRYQIPFFLDRREPVSHHPLAELTRSALRTVVLGWQHEDWFAALKTGLVPVDEMEIDRLENQALARGWMGSNWQKPIAVPGDEELTRWVGTLQRRLLPPFQRLALGIATHRKRPTGPQLAAALRTLWDDLGVEEALRRWSNPGPEAAEPREAGSVHATVWEQTNAWLQNVELAFPHEALSVREWLPILEAGLGRLTVGLIPPALDQVLIGAVDRSRNPDLKVALVLGLNETVFPPTPEAPVLLSEMDRQELEKRNVRLGATSRHQLGLERYYAYIACTRARKRLVLTAALQDADGVQLNLSPFLGHVQQLFPLAELEKVPREADWRESVHVTELIGTVLTAASAQGAVDEPESKLDWSFAEGSGGDSSWKALAALPGVQAVLERVRHLHRPEAEPSLSPAMAARLYGGVLRTSVSRLEQFAACPFKFFIHSGLRGEEREVFELDAKEQGTFQHDVLALFHEQLAREGKRWRDLTPGQARERLGHIAQSLMAGFRDGLLQATEQSRFTASVLVESLQDFVEVVVGWMREQYQFDPVAVELPFGEDPDAPAWQLRLSDGHRLDIYGRIDRVDLFREPGKDEALCVVVDYKSSPKKLDSVLIAHGLQLQLPTYLSVLRRWPAPAKRFGVNRLIPAGVFYVNLRGRYERCPNRSEALAKPEQARKHAYQHTGRFDARALPQLDARPNVLRGDQFNYRLTKERRLVKNSREAMDTSDFEAMLQSLEAKLRDMGLAIYSGQAAVAPFRRGMIKACDQCVYQTICRIDPWTQRYRVLQSSGTED